MLKYTRGAFHFVGRRRRERAPDVHLGSLLARFCHHAFDLIRSVRQAGGENLMAPRGGDQKHDLIYKPSGTLTSDQRPRVAFTAAQAWGADRIFEEPAQELVGGSARKR